MAGAAFYLKERFDNGSGDFFGAAVLQKLLDFLGFCHHIMGLQQVQRDGGRHPSGIYHIYSS